MFGRRQAYQAAANCTNSGRQRRPNLWMDRIAGDGSISVQWIFLRRLKGQIAIANDKGYDTKFYLLDSR